jgi:chemotaxis protein methyltransferase CheR
MSDTSIATNPMTNREPAPATVMVVDDTPASIAVLLSLLSGEGYKVLVAQNGEEALEQLRFTKPDLIMLDVMMPGLSGFEVCARLKADARLRTIPVLFMTALAEPEEKLMGFKAGGEDYITKPLQHDEVLARVKVHHTLYRAQRELETLNASLEQRIAERTAELSEANANLKQALQQIEQLKNQLQAENVYLKEEIREHSDHRAIVARSSAARQRWAPCWSASQSSPRRRAPCSSPGKPERARS